jgi:hypothetical protein
MLRRKKQLKKLLYDCYTELYKKATPSANFDELVENAPINERGEKVIDFSAYILDFDISIKIIEKYIKKGKLTFYEERCFRFEMFLGPVPVTIRKEEK